MGILKRLAEMFEGKKLYTFEQIPVPNTPSIIMFNGAPKDELETILKYWNEIGVVPEGTLITGRKVTIKELKQILKNKEK